MAKAASLSATPKRTTGTKKASSPSSPRARAAHSSVPSPVVTEEPEPGVIVALAERVSALEEKITNSFSSLLAEVQTLKATPGTPRPEGDGPADTFLPVVADLIRRNLMEHLTPITAALKRLEERVGFIGNRLKHGGGGPEPRQKPWRHDQPSRHGRPRGHNGPRPGQGQSWAPPSAASVQGHFAPRSIHSGSAHTTLEDEEE